MTLEFSHDLDLTIGNQDPVVEDGNWSGGLQIGLLWANEKVVAGSPNKLCASAFVGGSGADDGMAVRRALSNLWSSKTEYTPDQFVECIVHRDPTYTPDDTHEMGLLLRATFEPNHPAGAWATVYEFNMNLQSDIGQLAKWNGPLGDVTVLTKVLELNPVFADGDVIKMSIRNPLEPLIQLYQNGVEVTRWRDDSGTPPLTYGAPGPSFFIRVGTVNDVTKGAWKGVKTQSLGVVPGLDYTKFPKNPIRARALRLI